MRKPALDGLGQFPWDKLICDEQELILHLQESIQANEFGKPCARCGKRYVEVEDVEDICDRCWEIVQRAIE